MCVSYYASTSHTLNTQQLLTRFSSLLMPDKTTAGVCSKVNYLSSHLFRNPPDCRLLCPEYTLCLSYHVHIALCLNGSWDGWDKSFQSCKKLTEHWFYHNRIKASRLIYKIYIYIYKKKIYLQEPKTVRGVLYVLSNILSKPCFSPPVHPTSSFKANCGALLYRTTSTHGHQLPHIRMMLCMQLKSHIGQFSIFKI